MKILTLFARLLLGIMFVFFGSNGVHPFMPMPPPPPGLAGQFSIALMDSHYMQVVSVLMVISGLLFLVNRFVPLALVLLGPILVNILLFHALILHAGFQLGVLATVLWFIVFYYHRAAFAGIFQAKT
jgi:putative oxidoreductase